MAAGKATFSQLRLGWCLVEQNGMVTGLPPGSWWNVPINGYLVRSGESQFLFDTGMPRNLIERPWALFRPEGGATPDSIVAVMRPNDAITARLDEAGISPSDLDGAITSHWHFDHAGGMADLAGVPILAQKAEIEAHRGAPDSPYWVKGDHRLSAVEGDHALAPGITLLSTPGHTPGHQSMLVETAHGAYIFTSDAVYTKVNWESDTPGAMADPETGRRSVLRLRDVARETGAHVIFSHDPVQTREMKPFPHWYGD